MIDISIFKNIDFVNADNLLFLAIFLILVIIVFAIVLFIFAKIIKVIRGILKMEPKSVLNENQNQPENFLKEEQKIIGLPKQRIMGGDFIKSSNSAEEKIEAKIDVKKAEEAREKAKISEQLNKFKGDNSPDQGDALASKMPMREEYKDDNFQKIKIPVAKKNFQESTGIAASSPKSIDQADQKEKPGLLQEKPDLLKDKLKPATTDNDLERGGSVMFGNKQEITRRELKYKLWKDPKVYKAARESLLYLSPTERVKLEKELFPKAYGLNISKSDIKTRMRKLSQKMINEKNPQAKATLRKKIKFIKKIGGA